MQKLDIAKKISSTIVGIGTGKIVGDVIANNTTPQNVIDKITIGGAGIVIGSMSAAATKAHTDKMVEETAQALTVIAAKFKK